jgi:hypothetical protein
MRRIDENYAFSRADNRIIRTEMLGFDNYILIDFNHGRFIPSENLAQEADQILDPPRRKGFEKASLSRNALKAMRYPGGNDAYFVSGEPDRVSVDGHIHLARKHKDGLLFLVVFVKRRFGRMDKANLVDA